MLVNRTKYGFLSDYQHTVFLRVWNEDGPKVLFSKPIPYSNTANVEGEVHPTISVRLALLYFTFKALEKDWWLEKADTEALRKQWIKKRSQPI
jgi:hypothetical protein